MDEPLKETLRRDLGVHLKDQWLRDCLAFVQTMPNPPPATISARKSAVIDQLLISDLRQITNPSLPERVGEMANGVLNGPYLVQVPPLHQVV